MQKNVEKTLNCKNKNEIACPWKWISYHHQRNSSQCTKKGQQQFCVCVQHNLICLIHYSLIFTMELKERNVNVNQCEHPRKHETTVIISAKIEIKSKQLKRKPANPQTRSRKSAKHTAIKSHQAPTYATYKHVLSVLTQRCRDVGYELL